MVVGHRHVRLPADNKFACTLSKPDDVVALIEKAASSIEVAVGA